MKTLVEPLEGNKVKLSIEVDEQEFERQIEAAYRKIAREVRIPGFRPGKAPRRILEARLGAATGRAEALREALPGYYAEALREHEVDAIAAPEIDITAGEESGPVTFDAVVEVRPHLDLAGYGGLRVSVPSPVVTDQEIDDQIDRMRGNFGELSPVQRPAVVGDNLTIDLSASRDGVAVGGLTTDDFLYELGSATVLPELDTELAGASIGDRRAFDAELPDGPVHLEVTVKEVREKLLPEVDDRWASEASEFDTVAELRADLVKRMTMVKRVQATMAMRNGTVEALVELVDIDVPEALVNAETERQAHDLGHRLEQQGATISQYLQATGRSEAEVVAELRAAAVPAVKADLALRAVAQAEQLDPSDSELHAEVVRLAEVYQVTPEALRADLERSEQMAAVRSDLRKAKAVEWLVDHVELVDTDGRPLDRSLLEIASSDLEQPDSDGDTDSVGSTDPEVPGSSSSETAAPSAQPAPFESGAA